MVAESFLPNCMQLIKKFENVYVFSFITFKRGYIRALLRKLWKGVIFNPQVQGGPEIFFAILSLILNICPILLLDSGLQFNFTNIKVLL